ncbi:MAG: sigma-54-dependent Fis family transcriptional regulator [Myxococcales bacterium]|nr:MAG: sigma-54-dependent Fis family transcriptional regulator [Myxococcales bacterium]
MSLSATLKDIPVAILVAEDDPDMRDLLAQALGEEGYAVATAKDGDEAIARLGQDEFDLVLTDLKMPGASGMDVLKAARAQFFPCPVILMTAFGAVDSAVMAMKEGAYSYITKPFDLEDLLILVTEVAEQIRLRKQSERLLSSAGGDTPFPIVFRSRAFTDVMKLVHELAASPATVLITGESGTGKELIAREIHRQSDRRSQVFKALDVNAIPETLIEGELFGHAKGSFTGADRDKAGLLESANGGTLFLDEIGELSLAVQAKLLRFLQERVVRRVGESAERAVDARLITATNRDLQAMMAAGQFREDLFYRLSVFHIRVPPLRERREDIAPLVYHFLRKYNKSYRVEGFRADVLDALADFHWPGNVRQLENAVEHAVILRKAGLIQKKDLPEWVQAATRDGGPRTLDEIEKNHILKLLQECGGNQSRAARILGINRRTLSRKLKSYGLPVDDDEF